MGRSVKCGSPVESGMVIDKECYELLKTKAENPLLTAAFFNRCYAALGNYLADLEDSKSYLRLDDELESVNQKIAEVQA